MFRAGQRERCLLNYAEDCLPYATRPLWRALNAGFRAEKAAQR